MMHSQDAKLSKFLQTALKLPKGSSAPKPSLIGMPDTGSSEAMAAVKTVALAMGRPANAENPDDSVSNVVAEIRKLAGLGFPQTVSTLLGAHPGLLKNLEFQDLDLIACTEGNIAAWINATAAGDSDGQKNSAENLLTQAIKEPAAALECALAVWCCKTIDSKKILRIMPLLTAAEACGRATLVPLLGILLQRDKNGDFVVNWLKSDSTRISDLERLITTDSKMTEAVLKSAAIWMTHPQAGHLIPLYLGIMTTLSHSGGRKRTKFSSAMLGFAGQLVLLVETHPAAVELLQALQRLGLEIWRDAEDSDERRHTWAFLQAGSSALLTDPNSVITPKIATGLGIAIERMRSGVPGEVALGSALLNLGAERIGETGARVSYNPLLHEDTESGMEPGEDVVILSPGYRAGTRMIIRAAVKR